MGSLAQADVRVVIATDPYANKLAHSLLEKALKYSALNDVEDRISILYAASPGGDLALPRYDDDIRDFMDAMVESTRVSFDLHSWAEGSDSAHSVTDGFDTFSSDSEESSLPLLQQLIRAMRSSGNQTLAMTFCSTQNFKDSSRVVPVVIQNSYFTRRGKSSRTLSLSRSAANYLERMFGYTLPPSLMRWTHSHFTRASSLAQLK